MVTQQTGIDSDIWSGIEPVTARRLLLAALDSFAAVGYESTTTREIAQRAGLSPAGVYTFYASKAELLATISRVGHEAALEVFEAALASGASPSERVSKAVCALATWHAEHRELARVVQQELRSLAPEARASMRVLRGRFETLLEAELDSGVQTGEFGVHDIAGTTNAILSLCVDITRWYSPRSRYSAGELGSLYAELSLRMLAVRQQ